MMARGRRVTAGALMAAVVLSTSAAAGATSSVVLPKSGGAVRPVGTEPVIPRGQKTQAQPMTYHGGPVFSGTMHLYEIWYGNWSPPLASARQSIFNRFVDSVGSSPYISVLSGYTDKAHATATGKVEIMSSVIDNYSNGKHLSDADVSSIVTKLISTGVVPADPLGTYLVLTSADVTESSGFGQRYCAWHGTTKVNGHIITTGFLGDPSRHLASCGSGQVRIATGDRAGDALVATGAHLLFDLAVDPTGSGWHDAKGREPGARCVGRYPVTAPSHSTPGDAVITSGTQQLHYWLQQTWVNNGALGCALTVGVSPAHRG